MGRGEYEKYALVLATLVPGLGHGQEVTKKVFVCVAEKVVLVYLEAMPRSGCQSADCLKGTWSGGEGASPSPNTAMTMGC